MPHSGGIRTTLRRLIVAQEVLWIYGEGAFLTALSLLSVQHALLIPRPQLYSRFTSRLI